MGRGGVNPQHGPLDQRVRPNDGHPHPDRGGRQAHPWGLSLTSAELADTHPVLRDYAKTGKRPKIGGGHGQSPWAAPSQWGGV